MKLNQDFAMAIGTIRFLAKKPPEKFIRAEDIARTQKFSLGYLQKVIQQLSRQGIVESKRGRIGGVRLRAKVITLLDLWELTCGGLDFTDPSIPLMNKPVKAFRDALGRVIIHKR